MSLRIKDGPGKIPTVEEARDVFEMAVANTDLLRRKMKMDVRLTSGDFDGYQDAQTDNIWFGFALGLRCAHRLNNE